jgi:hypothetical protein
MYLAPHKLALVRRARGLRPRVIAATELAVPAATSGETGPLFARLAEVLAESTWHDANARVVVADHPWARYGVVPWTAASVDESGRAAHARYVLGDSFGDKVSDWALTLADAPPGRPAVACAMPPGFRAALEEALAPARLTLISLQPRLVVAFNTFRHRLPADDAWFVSLDDGSLSAAHVNEGAWDRVHMARLSADWTIELERLQAFGRLTGAACSIFVDAPAWMRKGASIAGVEWLEDDAADASQGYELAFLHRTSA